MDQSPMPPFNESGRLFYKMYRDLPLGAVLVDSSMTVISSNRRMCAYFGCGSGPEGLPLGKAVHCGNICGKFTSCGQAKACGGCGLRECAARIISGEMPVSTNYTYCPENACGRKWFKVNGFRIEYVEAYAAMFFSDITEYEQREREMEKKLEFDYPTMALNKYGLKKSLASLAGKKSSFSVCMVDFDNFKRINDLYGHVEGDRVLSAFAGIARESIRSGDILARYGGEEFVFVFMNTALDDAVKIVSRVQHELRKRFEQEFSQPVTFSAGIAHVSGKAKCAYSGEELIKIADGLLYEAKKNGKNQIVACGDECCESFTAKHAAAPRA